MGADGIECQRVPHHATYPGKRPVLKRQNHEHLVRAGERRKNPGFPGGCKAKPGVVCRMADHNHDAVPETLALPDPRFDESCPNTLALVILVYCERRKGKGRGLHRTRNNGDRAEQDVPDDPVPVHGNKGEFRVDIAIVAQGIHKPCLAILPERLELYFKNSGNIFREFRPDIKRMHPDLLVGEVDKEGVKGRSWYDGPLCS
jgi:hypothetical protein